MFNNINGQKKTAMNIATESKFNNGYEEEIVNTFRQIPEYKRRQTFTILMTQMEQIINDLEVI